jgi:hypothetical protein
MWSATGMSTAQLHTSDTAAALGDARPERAVIVISEALAPGHAANAAAVLALTFGARMPELPGPPVTDADGVIHPGLYPAGLPVLRAGTDALVVLHRRARDADGVAVVAFPAAGQTTTDYDAFRAVVAETPTADLELIAVLVCGPAKPIRRLTGSFGLMR